MELIQNFFFYQIITIYSIFIKLYNLLLDVKLYKNPYINLFIFLVYLIVPHYIFAIYVTIPLILGAIRSGDYIAWEGITYAIIFGIFQLALPLYIHSRRNKRRIENYFIKLDAEDDRDEAIQKKTIRFINF